MAEQLRLRGHLKGHGGWVTQIATSPSQPDMIMSSSRGQLVMYVTWPFMHNTLKNVCVRGFLCSMCVSGTFYVFILVLPLPTDKSVIVWNLLREEGNYGIAKKALRGHNHFVSDVVVSSDGMFALSGSWDATLRLWDLQT